MGTIHSFESLHTDGAGGTLIVRGKAVDDDGELVELGAGTEIFIAVMRAGHLTNRTSMKLEAPVPNPWTASTGSHHFNDGDEVYAVGAVVEEPGGSPQLFADGFSVT